MSKFGLTFKTVTVAVSADLPVEGQPFNYDEIVFSHDRRVQFVSRQMVIRGNVRDYGNDIFSLERKQSIVIVRGAKDARFEDPQIWKPVRVAISNVMPIEGHYFEYDEIVFNEHGQMQYVHWKVPIRGNTRYYGNGVFTVKTKKGVVIVKTFLS